MPKGRYVPGKRRLVGPVPRLTEAQYRDLLRQGKPVPQGARVKFGKPRQRSAEELGIRFREDGSVEIPRYTGPEGALVIAGYSTTRDIPTTVRFAQHQLESVRAKAGTAKIVFDTVARIHYDLEHRWKTFNEAQRASCVAYSLGVIGLLAKNPDLLREEQKIQACSMLERAAELLKDGNAPAAEATLLGVKNRLGNWSRKLDAQNVMLQRRRKLVVDRYFQKETRIWGTVDSLITAFARLGYKFQPKALQARLLGARDNLYRTGMRVFRQPAKIIESAASYVGKGEVDKAKKAIRRANQLIVLAASPISSIYPDKLKMLILSREPELDKKGILSNQAVLYHDMLALWWNPRFAQKTALMLDAVRELSNLAENIGRKDVAQMISEARRSLEENNIDSAAGAFARAAVALKPELAEELG